MSIWSCLVAVVQLQSCDVATGQGLEVVRHSKGDVALPVMVKPVAGKTVARRPALKEAFGRPERWQGFYVGGTLGYGSGETTQSYDRNANHGLATVKPDGVVFSATGGYNYMITPSILAGIEGDLGVMALNSPRKNIYDGHLWKAEFGPFWGTVRGRVGYVRNDWVIYGTGGLAFMQTDSVSIGNTVPETAIDDKFRAGWVIGAGVEYAINDRWSGKFEYLHMNFGKYSGLSANNEDFYFKDKIDLFRVGVNYRF